MTIIPSCCVVQHCSLYLKRSEVAAASNTGSRYWFLTSPWTQYPWTPTPVTSLIPAAGESMNRGENQGLSCLFHPQPNRQTSQNSAQWARTRASLTLSWRLLSSGSVFCFFDFFGTKLDLWSLIIVTVAYKGESMLERIPACLHTQTRVWQKTGVSSFTSSYSRALCKIHQMWPPGD